MPDEPGRQRDKVHQAGTRGDRRAAGRRSADLQGRGHRHRDSEGRAGECLQGVPAGRRDGDPRVRGNGPGLEHYQEVRRDARRPHLGRERAAQGQHVHFHHPAAGERRWRMSEKTVLYVEDNEYNRKIVRQLFKTTSYKLIEAVDGEDGVALAQKELPNLILMDVQLPKMSGLDATKLLKADVRTSHIPVIVITSFALSGDRERAAEAGATSYLAKPYSPRELLALVREQLPES